MIKWFGPVPFATLCEMVPRVAIPTGASCQWCGEPIGAHDNGMYFANGGDPLHHECFVRQTVGSVGHQRRECSCFGGTDAGDPAGLTLRQAAVAAAHEMYRRQHPAVPVTGDEGTIH